MSPELKANVDKAYNEPLTVFSATKRRIGRGYRVEVEVMSFKDFKEKYTPNSDS